MTKSLLPSLLWTRCRSRAEMPDVSNRRWVQVLVFQDHEHNLMVGMAEGDDKKTRPFTSRSLGLIQASPW